MDSSLNKPSQIIEINSYVVNNLNLFDSILNSLESVSTEAKILKSQGKNVYRWKIRQ